jgi:hypothetical protein
VKRRLLIVASALGAAALLPASADAHGLVGREDLPIPSWLFAWAASAVLVASFVGLSVLWPRPRLEYAHERRLFRVPVVAEVLAGAFGIAAFALTVYAGYAGIQNGTANLAPTVIYVLFWVGIPFASVLFGNVFAAISPWRAVARATGWVARRANISTPEPLKYPERVGRWPAAVGIFAFAWLELAYVNRDDPSTLATLALVYAAVMLVGMALYGVDQWTRNADPFAVAWGLIARLSPLHWHDRRVELRPPLGGAPLLDPRAGTVALLAVMIGTTTFDGFSQGPIWSDTNGVGPFLQERFQSVGFGADGAAEVAGTIGLLLCVGLVAGLYRIGVRGMSTVGRGHTTRELSRRFVHSLLPIAVAYLVAHYFSLLAFQTQAVAYLVSDPLGNGSDLFGTADATINYNLISTNGIWYVQVAALVIGHVGGLILAHDRALVIYSRAREATRSQYWMLAVMVSFTTIGLYLLSATA